MSGPQRVPAVHHDEPPNERTSLLFNDPFTSSQTGPQQPPPQSAPVEPSAHSNFPPLQGLRPRGLADLRRPPWSRSVSAISNQGNKRKRIESPGVPQHFPRAPRGGRSFSIGNPLRQAQVRLNAVSNVVEDDRLWYDQFTSTDWLRDNLQDIVRKRNLREHRGFVNRLLVSFDKMQGWVLVAVIGFLTATVAYAITVGDSILFEIKDGFCTGSWFSSHKQCCTGATSMSTSSNGTNSGILANDQCLWKTWSQILGVSQQSKESNVYVDLFCYVSWTLAFAIGSCFLTLKSKSSMPAQVVATVPPESPNADENQYQRENGYASIPVPSSQDTSSASSTSSCSFTHYPNGHTANTKDPEFTLTKKTYYTASGSGVPEVKVILSGFVLHKFLGIKTLALKAFGLVLAVSSGMSLGKEGPYVHIASCIGNILCRIFDKYRNNDAKRREVLSASAASGVAVAFGAPISGVLFSLEEVSYYFSPKTLFRTFFCCIVAALSLKLLNPYGTGKIVLFEVQYVSDWAVLEMPLFVLLGVMGGALGALFIKVSKLWTQTFRQISIIKRYPMMEVFLVALVTGILGFWNRYTKLPVSELLFELASPCETPDHFETGLCPDRERLPRLVHYLTVAFLIKGLLTIITFGVKMPAGIYVPSMVVGGLMGRIVGHTAQYVIAQLPDNSYFLRSCSTKIGAEFCINPGVYALIAAGSTMCGVTRLSITLAIILFELTGNIDYVLPFSLAVLFAKWTADAIEPLSIYDLLLDMNAYPYLHNELQPNLEFYIHDTNLIESGNIISITTSPKVKAIQLRSELNKLLRMGEIDTTLPIVKGTMLMGLLPASVLKFALDKLDEDLAYIDPSCLDEDGDVLISLMDHDEKAPIPDPIPHSRTSALEAAENGYPQIESDIRDLSPWVDFAPVSLNINSPINLVHECFVKLGVRYLCVLDDGKFVGLIHRKAFAKFVNERRLWGH